MRLPRLLMLVALGAACRSSDLPAPSATTGSATPAGSASGSGPAIATSVATGSSQSAREAVALVCDAEARSGATTAAPAERVRVIAHWLREQVTHPEIAALVASLDTMSRADGQRLVADAARRHGITPCAFVAPPAPPFELPAIPSGGEADDGSGARLLVSPTSIVLEGTAITSLTAGALDPATLERGTIPGLTRRVKAAPPVDGVRVAFAATTPARTVLPVLATLAEAGVTRLSIVGRAGDLQMILPIEVARAGAAPAELTISLDADRTLRLWSTATTHGTQAAPSVEAALDGGLGQLARGLAQARSALAPGREPPPVTVLVDDRLDVATLLGVVATVRTMFPRVQLSSPPRGRR